MVSSLTEPLLSASDTARKGRVLMGSVEGDAHEIGKNIVIAMLRCASYEVDRPGHRRHRHRLS